jgi:glycogen debranching enzyme
MGPRQAPDTAKKQRASIAGGWDPQLMRLRVRPYTHYASQNRTVLATSLDGFLYGKPDEGLFIRETRCLSDYRYLANGRLLHPVSLSNVRQNVWLGYYLVESEPQETPINDTAQQAVEVQLSRRIDDGLHEEVAVTNYTQARRRLPLRLELGADFLDIAETPRKRRQRGRKSAKWQSGKGRSELTLRYQASHRYSHQGDRGQAFLACTVHIVLTGSDCRPKWKGGALHFGLSLHPQETWRCRIEITAEFSAAGKTPARLPVKDGHPAIEKEQAEESRFSTRESETLAPVVGKALKQGKRDLAALRLFDLDRKDGGWVPAAGLPLYIALFGRDTLTAAWEAAPLTTRLMRGTLPAIAALQGKCVDPWRDEQPGRMLHEMHTGPLSVLNYIPQGRDYGSVTTSAFFPFVLAQLWHWTGDKSLVARYLDPAARAMDWIDRLRAKDRDGFCRYQTHSAMGVENQSWKDSGDAIVYEDGSQVSTPIATCEQQGIIYAAKMNFAETLWWFDRKVEARKHYRDAVQLKKKFNRAFWMEKEGFIAMALDAKGRQVRSIASNPVHCVATGILDKARVPRVLARIFAPDLFSGWGVRTLSSQHPSFNPYAYHRGAVWPVEHGPLAVGAYRYGQHRWVEKICRAQFELASLFDHAQLPECVTGHQRDEAHPFPAVYPAANAPQAWSATTPFTLLQAMLGMQPFAPLKFLFIDPFLPPWLPEITISNMRVGNAQISLRFFRTRSGRTDYKVLEKQGTLRILRQPSPWSFTATLAERARDTLSSIFH